MSYCCINTHWSRWFYHDIIWKRWCCNWTCLPLIIFTTITFIRHKQTWPVLVWLKDLKNVLRFLLFFELNNMIKSEICLVWGTNTPPTSITSFSLCVIRLKLWSALWSLTTHYPPTSAPEAPVGQVALLHVLVLFCSALAVTPKLFAKQRNKTGIHLDEMTG